MEKGLELFDLKKLVLKVNKASQEMYKIWAGDLVYW